MRGLGLSQLHVNSGAVFRHITSASVHLRRCRLTAHYGTTSAGGLLRCNRAAVLLPAASRAAETCFGYGHR